MVPGPGWDLIDSVHTAAAAAKIVEAIEAWATHVPAKPPQFQEPLPSARAIEALSAIGPEAIGPLRESLARGHRHVDVVAAALRALGERVPDEPPAQATSGSPAATKKEKKR